MRNAWTLGIKGPHFLGKHQLKQSIRWVIDLPTNIINYSYLCRSQKTKIKDSQPLGSLAWRMWPSGTFTCALLSAWSPATLGYPPLIFSYFYFTQLPDSLCVLWLYLVTLLICLLKNKMVIIFCYFNFSY